MKDTHSLLFIAAKSFTKSPHHGLHCLLLINIIVSVISLVNVITDINGNPTCPT